VRRILITQGEGEPRLVGRAVERSQNVTNFLLVLSGVRIALGQVRFFLFQQRNTIESELRFRRGIAAGEDGRCQKDGQQAGCLQQYVTQSFVSGTVSDDPIYFRR
jgi:hypothetical protein